MAFIGHVPTSGALCQVEKVVLFFLAKQGELASRLLDEGANLSRYGDIPARSLRSVYISIGGEIAELMRFLQLNGKASRTIPLRTENMALSGEHFGPIILQCFCLLCFLSSFFHFVHHVTLCMSLLPSVPLCCAVSALRKILEKHDKQMRDNLIATKYLGTRAKEKYSFLRQLYHNEGILSLVACLKRSVRRERT